MSEELNIEALREIRLVVGLGNPGAAYAGNRHNIGFMVIDELVRRFGAKTSRKAKSDLAKVENAGRELFLQKPVTFMNLSGDAVRKLCRREKISADQVLVVYDDLALKPGRIRVRFGGGSGGHNGIKSMTARLGTGDFGRLRLGIGHPGSADVVADYVLQDFAECERELIGKVVERATEAVLMLCDEGYEAAMNVFNGQSVEVSHSEQPNQE